MRKPIDKRGRIDPVFFGVYGILMLCTGSQMRACGMGGHSYWHIVWWSFLAVLTTVVFFPSPEDES